MDERVLRFRVGVVVVAAAIITIILITLLGAWPSPFKPRYTVHVKFNSAPGVTVDTPVRKSGIQIGRVSDLELQDDGKVRLTLKIDQQYRLTRNQKCRISTGSMVTGDAVLEWVSSDDRTAESEQEILDGDELSDKYTEVAPDLLNMIYKLEDRIDSALASVEGASQSIGTAGREVEQVAQSLNRILATKAEDSDELVAEQLVTEMLQAVKNFNLIMGDVKEITERVDKERLRSAVERLPDLFANAEKTLTEAQNTLNEFSRVAVRAERNLANLEEVTAPLAERGEEISQNLVASINSVSDLLDNLAQLSQSLNNEDGTIGQLIKNPELYDRVSRTAAEIEELVRRLEPILNDVRVITHKISTDPAQMGVKGILDRRPSGVGQKWPTGFPTNQRSGVLHQR